MRWFLVGLFALSIASLVAWTPRSAMPDASAPERTPAPLAEHVSHRAPAEARRASSGRSEGGDMPASRGLDAPGGALPGPVVAPSPQPRRETRARSPGSPPTLQQLVPGSPQHARALGATLESAPYRATLEPIARLYLASLQRVPDYEGLDHYVTAHDAGIALADIAQDFAGSPEFGTRYGELDDAAFVQRLLANVGADAALGAEWIARLRSGEATRGEVIIALSEGAAFRAATRDAVFVTLAYAEALRRMPTAAELSHWVGALHAGGSREAVLEALVRGRGAR